MDFETLTKTEQAIIRQALEEKQNKRTEDLEFWKNLEWENIGDLKNMYADKQAFETHKKGLIEDMTEDINIIENLLERMYEM
mgnify:CR=1 FL=1